MSNSQNISRGVSAKSKTVGEVPSIARFGLWLSLHRNWLLFCSICWGGPFAAIIIIYPFLIFPFLSEPIPLWFFVIMSVISICGGAVVGEINWWLWGRYASKLVRKNFEHHKALGAHDQKNIDDNVTARKSDLAMIVTYVSLLLLFAGGAAAGFFGGLHAARSLDLHPELLLSLASALLAGMLAVYVLTKILRLFLNAPGGNDSP